MYAEVFAREPAATRALVQVRVRVRARVTLHLNPHPHPHPHPNLCRAPFVQNRFTLVSRSCAGRADGRADAHRPASRAGSPFAALATGLVSPVLSVSDVTDATASASSAAPSAASDGPPPRFPRPVAVAARDSASSSDSPFSRRPMGAAASFARPVAVAARPAFLRRVSMLGEVSPPPPDLSLALRSDRRRPI